MKKHLLAVILPFILFFAYSQDAQTQGAQTQSWVKMMQDPNANFYDVQEAFYTYWSDKTMQKGKGYKVFKRWEAFMQPRVYPTGEMTQASQAYTNYKDWERNTTISTEKSVSGQWTILGPTGAPTNGGAGRLNFLRFDPTNSNTMYVGTPDGGLWKSTNAGGTWLPLTDQLTVIGCTDILIDPTNTQIMYLATGDGEAGDSYSVGVLKSTDGGATWNATGLNWTVNLGRTISKLLMDPTNSSIILAATSAGIYRSTNGGTTFTQEDTRDIKDMEFKPGDPNTVYAAGDQFLKSLDNGASWSLISSGLPSASGVQRIAIAVSPANANYVYLLIGKSSDQGLYGIYRSANSGTTFTQRHSGTPNLLGWESDGNDTGGQAFYDLTIAASPLDAESIVVGGVNVWKSNNGGTSFAINAHWWGDVAPYVHADHHDLVYLPGTSTYFSCNDGGLFKTTNNGSTWSDLSSNLQIAQQYRISISQSTADLIVTGHQDNGTNKYNGTTWSRIYGGDGMDCFIDRTNNNTIIASYVYGTHYKSTNGGSSWTDISSSLPNGSGQADWLSVLHQDPVTANTYYAGGRSPLYKSTNGGSSWTTAGTPTGAGSVLEFAIAPSNNQVIYTLKQNAVAKTTNGGTTWASVSTGLPVSSLTPTYIAVSDTDPNVAFVTFSGYNSTNKVYKTTNGGTSWTNISTGLPNVPCNAIVYHNGSANQSVYIGTDVGVYYKDNTLASWTMYSTNLPRVSVRDLEIYYSTGKLRAGTYGRGTWESDLYSVDNTPVADFSASTTSICPTQSVTFTDLSAGSPTAYSWSFPGGTPATSTDANPTITYNGVGVFDVTLTITTAGGNDTEIKSGYINVNQGTVANLPFNEDFADAAFLSAPFTYVDAGGAANWEHSATVGIAPSAGNSMFFNNYATDETGFNDEVWMPTLTFSGISSPTLTFDVAYAPYDATYNDGLEVLVSTDCGLTFNSVYSKSYLQLATAAAIASAFIPADNEWRNESVDLSAYANQSGVIIAFRNLAGYGNLIYVDNINVVGGVTLPPVASFTSSQTTTCQNSSITFTSTSTGNPSSYAWTFPGGTPNTSSSPNPTIVYATAGTYDVSLTATNAGGSDVETQTSYITVNANPVLTLGTITNPTACSSNTGSIVINGSGTGTINWTGTAAGTQNNVTLPFTISNLAAGSYSVNFVNAATCNSNIVTTTLVDPTPPATPTITANGPTTFCEGQSVVLTSSATGVIWSSGQNTQAITVTTSGQYSVTKTVNGCSSTSLPITVVVNALPATPTISANGPTTFCEGQSVVLTSSATGVLWSSGQNTQAITVTTAGQYSVTKTVSGCSSTSLPITVVVNALPTTPTISANGPTTFCEGESVILTSSDANGILWSSGESTQTVLVTIAGQYTVEKSENGCSSSSLATTVVVNALPTVTFDPIADLCSSAAPFELTQGNPQGGGYTGNGIVNTTFSPSTANLGNNVLTYFFTDGNGCANSNQTTVVILDCANVVENTNEKIKVFPNPTSGVLNIQGQNLRKITLHDQFGRILYQSHSPEDFTKINLENYASGMYFLEISTNTSVILEKIEYMK